MSKLKKAIPWWLRIAIKIVIARLPVSYAFWKRLRVFEHGDMNLPQRAFDNFLEHARTANLIDMNENIPFINVKNSRTDQFTVLELGPGDSLFSAVIARCLGATKTILVDAGEFAFPCEADYDRLFEILSRKGVSSPIDRIENSNINVIKQYNGEYLTQGVTSLTTLPDASIDYCYSNAVLEHIPRSEFGVMVEELLRVLKPSGLSVHRVDLRDHLGGGLNNLRFSDERWESDLFTKSGFYTNRIRFLEMISIFESIGFECEILNTIRWGEMPLPRLAMDKQFQYLDEEDLLVSCFDLVLRHRPSV